MKEERERGFSTERWVNTLMSGAKTARSGQYVSAGYARDNSLYIADVPAGSRQDSLRDLNKEGYRSERPWRETPTPVFEELNKKPVHKVVKRTKKPSGFVDGLLWEARRDKKGVALCVLLMVLILMMGAVWGQKLVEATRKQRGIEQYQQQTIQFEKENEQLAQQLEIAKSGERIRNLAQNELGMLRRERAQTEEIYIQVPDEPAGKAVQSEGGTKMELLDFFLGLLSVFHIGE